MAFFDFIKRPKKEKGLGRGKARAADERMKMIKARALETVYKTRPDLIEQAVLREAGLAGDQGSDIQKLIKTFKDLKSAGFIEDPKSVGDNDWLKTLGKGLGEGIIPLILQMLMANNPQMREMMNPNPTPQITPIPTPQPTAIEAPSQPVDEHEEATEEQEPNMLFSVVKSQLANKSPDDAAKWLLAMAKAYPQAAPLVQQLCNTPNQQLPALLNQIEQSNPGSREFISWLRSRPEWFVATVNAIRQQVSSSKSTSQQNQPRETSAMGF